MQIIIYFQKKQFIIIIFFNNINYKQNYKLNNNKYNLKMIKQIN